MKNILIIYFVLVGLASAGGSSKYAGEFMALGVGSRAMALAGAATALSGDATATYWNPAGLTDSDGWQAHFMNSKQFISSVQNNFLALSYRIDQKQAAGISLLYLTVNGIKDSRDAYNSVENKVDYSKIKYFNTGDYAVFFSYSRVVNDRLQAGASLKTIIRNFYAASAFGVGFDLALKYHLAENLRLGAVLRDALSTPIIWNTKTREYIYPSLRLGLAYTHRLQRWPMEFTPVFDLEILGEGREYTAAAEAGPLSFGLSGGLETVYAGRFAIRAGLDQQNRLNAGAGISIPRLKIDYSFTGYSAELGDIHRISFQVQIF